jgi:serine/threonine protein kinase
MSNLHDYEIKDEIDSGAYGAVYRAWQPAVGREVAVKAIRPEHANIILDERGNAYLADFGIAKNLEAEVKLTATGAILGTPDYISPEQIKGEPLSPAADQYSLGIVLFEALTGRVPYPDESVAALFHKHLSEPLPLLATIDSDLPIALDPVLQRASVKEPADRYPEIMDVAMELRSAVSGQLSEAKRKTSSISGLPPFLEEGEQQRRARAVFVGRESELASLGDELGKAVQGQGSLTFIKGEVGSGKSALLSAFAGQASEIDPDLDRFGSKTGDRFHRYFAG